MNAQRGVALVSVLLVVAIATVMVVSMIQEQQASIQVTRGFLSRGQAGQYALGGEELARQILFEDFNEGIGRDHLAETWADPELHFEFEEGEVNLRIIDLQGLFNLNNLIEGNPGLVAARNQWLNLLSAQGGDAALADRLQDWLDADGSSRPTGAEDFDYLAFEPPYRSGNVQMSDSSELLLIGMKPEQYLFLEPILTTLPVADAKLNINTAPPMVLQSLAPSLTLEVAESLAEARDAEQGFETVEAFLQSPVLAGLGVAGDGLGVQSSFFEVRVIARYRDRFSYLTSVIHRDTTTGEMRVIARDFTRNFARNLAGNEKLEFGGSKDDG